MTHPRHPALLPSLLAFCLCAATRACPEEAAAPFVYLFDTGAPSPAPLAAEALTKRAGWTAIPEDTVAHAFKGDAAFLNNKLAVVLRRKGRGVEIYSIAASGPKHRATGGHIGPFSSWLEPIDSLRIIENGASAVTMEATFEGGGPATPAAGPGQALRFRLTAGEGILEVRPGDKAISIAVLARASYAVVPDFFADDMVFGREALRGIGLPAENSLLQLIEDGDAILMWAWQPSQQSVHVATAGAGRERNLCLSWITCVKGKSIWLAFLEGKGIWHSRAASEKDDWEPPFPAKWRCSLARKDGLADSWDLEKGPAPEQTAGEHKGPLVIYPLDRSKATPLTTMLPVDVMRDTLGVGPCEYILQAEGLASETNPTPDRVMTWTEGQFRRKKEEKAAEEIKERLKQMVEHVGHAEARIQRYSEFAREAQEVLAKDNSEAAQRLRSIIDEMTRATTQRTNEPLRPVHAAKLADGVASLIGKENALAECEKIGAEIRRIGADQDRALSKSRMAVRWLRQQCIAIANADPRAAELAGKIQAKAEQLLQRK